jgi:hypothetical protein
LIERSKREISGLNKSTLFAKRNGSMFSTHKPKNNEESGRESIEPIEETRVGYSGEEIVEES